MCLLEKLTKEHFVDGWTKCTFFVVVVQQSKLGIDGTKFGRLSLNFRLQTLLDGIRKSIGHLLEKVGDLQRLSIVKSINLNSLCRGSKVNLHFQGSWSITIESINTMTFATLEPSFSSNINWSLAKLPTVCILQSTILRENTHIHNNEHLLLFF